MEEKQTEKNQTEHEVLLHITIPADAFMQSYQKILNDKREALDLKGFRKGQVPSDLIEPQLETLILSETFERVAPYYVNAEIIKRKLQPAAPPEYKELKELVKGKDVEFDVLVTIIPQFKLGDLSKIKIKEESSDVTEDEIEQTLQTMYKNNVDAIDKDKKVKLDDKWAKDIAVSYNIEGVSDLEDLKGALREMMAERKQTLIDQDTTVKVINEAVKMSNIKIPDAAIQYEADQREEAFSEDLDRMKMTLEDFLKQRGITQEQLKEMWQKDSKEALENDVLLKLYAQEKGIEVSDKELADEVAQIKQSAQAQYKHEHAGHDHESNFDESVYDDPQWQSQIRSYLVKQNAYKALLMEVLGKIPGEKTPEEPKVEEKKKEEKGKEKGKNSTQGEKKAEKSSESATKKVKPKSK